MIIIDYETKDHKKIIKYCVDALKKGKVIAYPTDTSYGLAVDAGNIKVIKKLYKIKERKTSLPVHVVVPSVAYAKKIVKWNSIASKLAKKHWPLLRRSFSGQAGELTLVLPLKSSSTGLKVLSAGTKTLGIRMPKNKIALDLAKYLKAPITTTSANPPSSKGGYDSYNIKDILKQFGEKKYKPDIIIDAGKLPKRKPSTMIKIDGNQIEILRTGAVTKHQINKSLNAKR